MEIVERKNGVLLLMAHILLKYAELFENGSGMVINQGDVLSRTVYLSNILLG